MVEINGVIYDILGINMARKYGIESEEFLTFIAFLSQASDDEAIQKEYKKIMKET